MKKKVMKITAVVLSLSMVLNQGITTAWAREKEEQPKELKIGVLSDTHYFSQNLYSDCEDFDLAMNSDRKMLKESGAILEATLSAIIEDAPDVVMISGDLTKDGEEINHRAMAKQLETLQEKLPETQIYVINGNHDINNPNGKDFSSGVGVEANTTTVEEFKEIYKNFGYDDQTEQFKPEGTDGGSLSYVARPAEGYTLIAVDSCKYSEDQTASGQAVQETGGMIGDDLLQWVEAQAKKAKAAGDVVLVLEHHGVVPHFSQEPVVMKDYLVDNYPEVSEVFANAGVNYVFTGHMHANDIASYTSSTGNTLYDIETGSLVTYPSLFRSVTIHSGTDNSQDGHSIESEMKRPNPVSYVDFDSGETIVIDDLTAYAKKLTLSKEVICTMINEGVLTPMLEDVVENGGVKSLIGKLLDMPMDQVTPSIVTMVTQLLPQTKDEGLPITVSGFSFAVYYNASTNAIMLDQVTKSTYRTSADGVLEIPLEDGRTVQLTLPEVIQEALAQAATQSSYGLFDPISLKVPDQKIMGAVDDLMNQVDQSILSTGAIQAVVENFVGGVLDAKVDDTHSVFDLVETVYQMHLAGNEQPEAWLEAALINVQEGQILPEIIKEALNATQPLIQEHLAKISITLGDIVEKGNDSLQTNVAHSLIKNQTVDGSVLLEAAGDLTQWIPKDFLVQLNDLAYQVAYSMSHDDNVSEDLSFKQTVEGNLPWDEPTPDKDENVQPNLPENHPTDVNPENPNTGDTTNIAMASLGLAMGAVCLVCFMRKKRLDA